MVSLIGSLSLSFTFLLWTGALYFYFSSLGVADLLRGLQTPVLESFSSFITKDKKILTRGFTRFFGTIFKPLANVAFRIASRANTDRSRGTRALARMLFLAGAAILTITLICFAYLLGINDTSHKITALRSSFELPMVIRFTSVALYTLPGSLLFFAFILCSILVVRLFKYREVSGISVELILLITGLATLFPTVFFPSAQPFRIFPIPLKMGAGAPMALQHWSIAVESVVYFATLALLMLNGALFLANHISLHSAEDRGPSRELLQYSLYLHAISFLLWIVWNFYASGTLWRADPSGLDRAVRLFLSGGAILAMTIERRRFGKGGYLSGMIFILGMVAVPVSLQVHSIQTNQYVNAMSGSSATFVYAGIMAVISLLVLMHFLFLRFPRHVQLLEKSSQPPSPGDEFAGWGAIVLSMAGLLSLVVSVTTSLPLNCNVDAIGRRLCDFDAEILSLVPFALNILLIIILLLMALWLWKYLSVQGGGSSLTVLAGAAILCALLPVAGGSVLFPYHTLSASVLIQRILYGAMTGLTIYVIGALIFLALTRKRLATFSWPGYAGLALAALGFGAQLVGESQSVSYHYYIMMMNPSMEQVHYYSPDKAYAGEYQIVAGDIFVGPRVSEKALKHTRTNFIIGTEAFLFVRRGVGPVGESSLKAGMTPYAAAHSKDGEQSSLAFMLTGYNPEGRIQTTILQKTLANPATGEVARTGPFGDPLYDTLKIHDTVAFPWEDITLQLEKVTLPGSQQAMDISHLYEYFYFDAGRSPEAYFTYFPHSINAHFQMKIFPGIKLLWIGLVLILLIFIYELLTLLMGQSMSTKKASGE